MRKYFDYATILALPALGKLALILSLSIFDKSNQAFANLLVVESLALIVFTFSFASFDVFLTRHWEVVCVDWVSISFQHFVKNIYVCITALFLVILLIVYEVQVWVFLFALPNQLFANFGRIIYSALRLERDLKTLGYILFANVILANMSFLLFVVIFNVDSLIGFFLATMLGNSGYLFFFFFRYRFNCEYDGNAGSNGRNRSSVSLTSAMSSYSGFLKTGRFLEFGSLVVQNVERMALYYIVPLETLNAIGQLYKFLTVLDIYSKLFKLVSLEKILSFVNFGSSFDRSYLRSRFLFFAFGLPVSAFLGYFLWYLFFLNEIEEIVVVSFSILYFFFSTSFYYTTALFKANLLIYNVFSDLVAVLISVVILFFSDSSAEGVLMTLSLRFMFSVFLKIFAAHYVKRNHGE